MKEYHKIQTVFKRDMANKGKTLLDGEWTTQEFQYLRNNKWVFTEKVDGTNIRVMMKDAQVVINGKTDNAQIPAKLFNRLTDIFVKNDVLQQMFPRDICLYGEGFGNGIQKAGVNYGESQDFVLFDVWCDGEWVERSGVEEIAYKLSIPVVPVIGRGTLTEAIEIVRAGFKSQWGDFTAEGIVARPLTELCNPRGERIITKIKCRDFNLV